MRVSRAAKATFLIINHVVATVVPPNLPFVNRLTEQDAGSHSEEAPSLITSRNAAPVQPALAPRNPQGGGEGKSCKCKVKCASKRKFVDPTKCTRCLPCPPGHVADPKAGFRSCVSEQPDPDADKKKKDEDERKKKEEDEKKKKEEDGKKKKEEDEKKKKEEDGKKKKEEDGKKKKEEDEKKKKRREEKEKKWPQKKEKMNNKFKNKAPDRKARNDQRKIKRLSLCIPIAPLAMGAAFATAVADEFFDEEYIESGEILEHWPEDMHVEEWELDTWNDEDEEKFYQGLFAESWVKFADETWEESKQVKRATPEGASANRTIKARNAVASEGPVREYGAIAVRTDEHHLEKRFFQLIGLVLGVAARIGIFVGQAVSRVAPAVMRIGTRAGRKGGKAKADKASQGSKIKQMKDKGPLKWCLGKKAPSKG